MRAVEIGRRLRILTIAPLQCKSQLAIQTRGLPLKVIVAVTMHHSRRFGGGEQRFLIVAAGEQAGEQIAVLLQLDLGRLLVDHQKAVPERILAECRVVEHGV